MKTIDMTDIHKKYKGLWVALKGPSSNIVIASGKTLKTTMRKAKKEGYKLPVMLQVPKRVLPIVGGYTFFNDL